MEFELEHADDEENVEDEELEDEDTKQTKVCGPLFCSKTLSEILLQARIKREQIAANKTVDGGVDDSDEEEEQHLTGEGRRMKRALGKIDQAYDSDDDDRKNPYASSVRILWLGYISQRRG
jgi:transcription initiation factor TFIIF subunit alpha